VILDEITTKRKSMEIEIDAKPGVTYTTQFIGTRKGFDDSSKPVVDADGNEIKGKSRIYSDEIGEVLFETAKNPAKYTYDADEIYVRAKVISSAPLDSPFQEGGTQTAWIQPVLVNP
jgi:hypothetical protein